MSSVCVDINGVEIGFIKLECFHNSFGKFRAWC
jgi:hypothetical protein